jgi:dGTPase
VFLSPAGDHYRTRLTHTLEVSQIARTIARALRLNEDLTEAIAMGHDLGHTPFGHAGERMLNELSPVGFHHYEQSLRVVDILENDGKGLNLTHEVRDGILKHTNQVASTFEGYAVRFADVIAYINHDIDDAIRAGVLTEEDLPEHPVNILGHSKSERITSCIMSIVNNGVEEIKMAPDITAAQDELHSFMFERVYRNPAAKSEEQKAKTLVQRLFQYYMKSPEKLPQLYKDIAERFSKERAVCDYISGMSDSYAVNLYKDIFIPRSWAVK